MITKDEIEAIINQQIVSTEKLGDFGSTSGHMSNISYRLNDFSYCEIEEGNIKINYSYTTSVETEFTYYPDNPPYEYNHEKELIIDTNKNIITDKLLHYSDNFSFDPDSWEDIISRIQSYLQQILEKIEWHYGDNRAPIKFPPEFSMENDEKDETLYVCIIETDGDEIDDKIKYSSDSPTKLLEKIQQDIPSRFNLSFDSE